VRIGDSGEAQRFVAKLPPRRFGQQHLLGENLEGHIAIQSLVARAKYHAHAARANLLDDAVMAKHMTDRRSRVRHSPDTRLANDEGQHPGKPQKPDVGQLFF
jgi:hypothetical protein